MRVYLTALGCKLNQSEAESWARALAAAGFDIVSDPAAADLHIVNTCAVTREAVRKSRQKVRRCARSNGQASLIVTGCFAQIAPAQAAALPGVKAVLGTADKEKLVHRIVGQYRIAPGASKHQDWRLTTEHTRAFVKIQDGCDNACTYCIVRVARGPQRSRTVPEVLNEVAAREHEGYQEIVLTGVHIGAYGRERGETLAGLVRAILDSTSLPRLRLSSIEPWDLSPGLLDLWQDTRLCRHLHLPLQSGCDATLARMNRRYSTAHYRDLVCRAREAISGLAVTTDVIVGFPGENEDEFRSSAAFARDMQFTRMHVFPFSSRPGTPAAVMPAQVPTAKKVRRVAEMCAISRRSSLTFRGCFLGRTMDVLWENRKKDRWSGLTDNYIRVWTTSVENLANRVLPTRLVRVAGDGVIGEPVL